MLIKQYSFYYLKDRLAFGYCSMGIHAYGLHGSSPHSTNNHGTRITRARFENLKAWKDAA